MLKGRTIASMAKSRALAGVRIGTSKTEVPQPGIRQYDAGKWWTMGFSSRFCGSRFSGKSAWQPFFHGGSLGFLGLKMSYQLDPQVITKDDSNRRSLRGWPQTPGVQFFQPHAPWILRADELIPMVKHQFAMAQFFGRPKIWMLKISSTIL